MRILANENFPGPVVAALRRRGHDVAWQAEDMQGVSDDAVLDRAQKERRIVATFDLDFGWLAFRARLPAECGILLFRLTGRDSELDNARTVAAIESREDWAGAFALVEDERIRVRELPNEG